MNKVITENRNLLELFSSCLIRDGKKGSGHKILFESLFFLRQNADTNLLNLAVQKDKLKNIKLKDSLQTVTSGNFSGDLLKNKNKAEEKQDKDKMSKKRVEVKERQKKEDLYNKGSKVNVKSQKTVSSAFSESAVLTSLLSKSICKSCVDNVKPVLETRKVRKGRVTYRVPLVTQTQRQEGKAVFFLIENATLREKGVASTFRKSIETKSTNNRTATVQEEQFSREQHAKPKNVGTTRLPSATKSDIKVLPSARHAQNAIQTPQQRVKTRLDLSRDDRFALSNVLPLAQPSVLPKATKSSTLKSKARKNLLNLSSEKELSFLSSLRKLNLYSIKHTLSEELLDSFFAKGESVEKKKQLHNLALQNRAYTHFRWW